MTALAILGGIVLILLLGLIRCRAEAAYDENGLRWRIRVGAVTVAPKDEKQRKAAKHPPRAAQMPKTKPDMAFIRALIDLALRLLKRFFRRLRIERLRVYFTSAFDDPYDTTMVYACVGNAMEAVTALADGRIRHLDLHTQLDYDLAQPAVDAHIVLSVRLGSLFMLAISAFFGYRSVRRRAKKHSEKENEHGKSVDR